MNNELFTQLYNASEYYRITNLYGQIYQKYENDINSCNQNYIKLKERKSKPGASSAMIIGFALFPMFVSYILHMSNNTSSSGTTIFILLVTAVLLVLNSMRCKKQTAKYQKEAEEYWNKEGGYIVAEDKKNQERAMVELRNFQEANRDVIEFLPERYRNYNATIYMADAVANGRADTFKEVANIYEEQLHRWELENINREIADEISFQNAMVRNQLENIYNAQTTTNNRLRNIETLEMIQFMRDL